MTIAGLVLAGGRGSRLGGADKATLELAGMSLLQRSVERLRPQVAAIAVSANGDPTRFAMPSLAVLPDIVPGFRGPLAGILSGLAWTESETPHRWMASVAVDSPFFPADLVPRLAATTHAFPDTIAVAASRGRSHPVFALWPVGCRAALDRFLSKGDSGKVMAFLEAQGYAVVEFDETVPGQDPFFNVNTREDLQAAQILATEEAR